MTTKKDNITKRIKVIGEGTEETQGISRTGFSDASGEYPKQDYFFGSSTNKSAKGETTSKLYNSGGDIGVSIDLPDQKPSQYPYNQVEQTLSGHSWEIDDTPGGERMIMKHRSGSGLELRADGSILFSAVNKKVEVTGGDHTVIVEGEGNLVYKGNLNVRVTGDYNVTVDGNYSLDVAGNKDIAVHGSYIKEVDKNENKVIKGSKSTKVVKNSSAIVLGNTDQFSKGNLRSWTQGDVEITSGKSLVTTAETEWAASSKVTNITGLIISVLGTKGTIGGTLVDHYGKAYSGPPDGAGNGGTSFYGTLVGRAAEAITSDFANKAGTSHHAKWADEAGQAQKANAETGPSPFAKDPIKYETIFPFIETPPDAPEPTSELIVPHLAVSNFGIRKVVIDTDVDDPNSLVAKILKTDDYDNLFDRDPTIEEIRSKLRDEANYNNNKFTGNLVAAGLLSSDYAKATDGEIGRTSSRKKSKKFGIKSLGNNPADLKSKRFFI